MDSGCTGRYLWIIRDEWGPNSSGEFYLYEVRVYLVDFLFDGATIIEPAPEPSDPLLDADNLVNNHDVRSVTQLWEPVIAFDTLKGFKDSCFVTSNSENYEDS